MCGSYKRAILSRTSRHDAGSSDEDGTTSGGETRKQDWSRGGDRPWRLGSRSGVDAADGDAELARPVDQVLGSAGTGEGDDALEEKVEKAIVAAGGRGASVAVPIGLILSKIIVA